MKKTKVEPYVKKSYKKLPKFILRVLGINSEEDLQVWFNWQEKLI